MLFLICVMFSFHGCGGLLSPGGKEFLITFQQNSVYQKLAPLPQCLALTTLLDTNVSVEVASLYPDISFTTSVTITNKTGEYVCLDNSIQQVGTGISRKVVRVTSPESINVIVYDQETHSMDAYPAISVDQYGTQYYVMSYWDGSQFSVTSTENNTVVNIEFPVRTNSSLNYEVLYNGVSHLNPTAVSIHLQKYEVFQLQMSHDMTGVFVSANTPVSVISGNKKTRIGYKGSRDHTAQQMPPVNTWGRRFITLPSPGKGTADFYRILTSGANTTVIVGNKTYSLEKEGDWIQVELSSTVPVEMYANAAILVVKMVTYDDGIDPCLMLIVPSQQWHNDYSFAFPQNTNYGYLLVVVETRFKTRLLLNSQSLDMEQWIDVNNMSVGIQRLPNAFYTLQSMDQEIVFAAYIHQTIRKSAFCSPVGTKMSKINPDWKHTRVYSEMCGSDSTSTVIPTTHEPSSTETTAASSTTDFVSTSITSAAANAVMETTFMTPFTSSTVASENVTEFANDTTGSVTNKSCSCENVEQSTVYNISEEEVQDIITRLQTHLKVVPNQTSKAIRTKISAADYRPSATAVGIVGLSVIILCVAAVAIADIPIALLHLRFGINGPISR